MFQMVRILILGVTRSNIYHLLCIVLDISVQQLIWQSLWWQVLHSSSQSFVKQSSQRQLSFPWLLSGLGSWPNIQCIYCHFQQSTYYYCTERVPQRKLEIQVNFYPGIMLQLMRYLYLPWFPAIRTRTVVTNNTGGSHIMWLLQLSGSPTHLT